MEQGRPALVLYCLFLAESWCKQSQPRAQALEQDCLPHDPGLAQLLTFCKMPLLSQLSRRGDNSVDFQNQWQHTYSAVYISVLHWEAAHSFQLFPLLVLLHVVRVLCI